MVSVPVKVCSTCGVGKPATLEFFYDWGKRKGGLRPGCRACFRAYCARHAKTYQRRKKAPKPRVARPPREKVCVDCQQPFPSTREFFGDGAKYCRPCGQARLERSITESKARAGHLLLERTCNHCGVTKPNTRVFFHAGMSNTCKACTTVANRVYREANPEVRRAVYNNRRARVNAAEGSFTAADVRGKLLRQNNSCYWCGTVLGAGFHVDHVIPLSKGGTNGPENIVCACPSCNLSKGAKMPWEFAGRLF